MMAKMKDKNQELAEQIKKGLEAHKRSKGFQDIPWDQAQTRKDNNHYVNVLIKLADWASKNYDAKLKIPQPAKDVKLMDFGLSLVGDFLKGTIKLPDDLAPEFKKLLRQIHGSDGCGLTFKDVAQRDTDERQCLKDRKFQLEQRQREDKALPVLLDHELQWIDQRLSWDVVDSLFKVLQAELFVKLPIKDHEAGEFDPDPRSEIAGYDVREFVALHGILLRDRVAIPTFDDLFRAFPANSEEEFKKAVAAFSDAKVKGKPEVIATYLHLRDFVEQRFYNALAAARGEYSGNRELYRNVLLILAREGQKADTDCPIVFAERWASIVHSLIRDNVTANDPYLQRRVLGALGDQVVGKDDAPPSSIEIDLPDLEEQADVEILSENVKAMQAIYFAGTLEELKLFQVRDKLVELFQIGMLPVIRGGAGDLIYKQMKKSVTRLSEYERRNLYARTLGMAGGDAGGGPNRDFPMLWLRFLSAVSSFARQMTVDNLLRARVPARVQQEQVRKAGRDLAANLSLYGYGMAYFAATELQIEINEIIKLLSDPEIKNSYGARDMWGVIDQVAALELGGARDSVRYRTMASSGAIIIRWLANHGQQLAAVGGGNILDENEIARPNLRPAGSKVTTDPFDSDLVNACERWLAVTGTPEARVEEYSQSAESPMMTSRPIQIPSAARDLLESVGINANGMGR